MKRSSTRRKLAIATWDAPREGNIYGRMVLDATEMHAYVERVREKSGVKVSMTHAVGRTVALALRESSGLNGRIRFFRYIPHETVDISFLVAFDGGRNLGKAKIERADEKSLVEMAEDLDGQANRIRGGTDDNLNKSLDTVKWIPTFLLRYVLMAVGYMSGVLGWSIPALGIERFAFGACCITNVGVFGLDEGFVPPTPYARCPVYILIGMLKDAPMVIDGEVVVRKQLVITATLDHRYMDGAQGGVLAGKIREIFANPTLLDLPNSSA